MVNEIVITVLRELEFWADLIEQGKGVNFGEIEERTNAFLGLSLNLQECLSLFSYTSKEFVHFQICKLLKNIVIRECQTNELDLFFHSLVHFVRNMPEISYCIEASLIEILCLVNKLFLGKTLCSEEQSVQLCLMAEEIISSNLHFLRKRGYLIMKALISEMLNDSSNFMTGITCEKHKSIKLIFQSNNLKRMMTTCVSSLDYYCQIEDPHSLSLISEIISVMSNLFSWTFLDVNSPSLPSWHEMSLQYHFPELLYKVFSKVRLINLDLTVEIFQCCVALLASAEGNVKESTSRKDFISKMVSFALTCLSLPNINKKEIFGATAIVQSLFKYFTSDVFLFDKVLLLKFLSVICETTCFLCQFSSDEDGVVLDALDNLLQSWFTLVTNMTSQDQDITNEIKICAGKIFQFYLRSHIMAPEGNRGICDMLKENQVEYNTDIEDTNDEVCFSDHLFIVGSLGRLSVGENLRIILNCLFSKTEKLREYFISESELCLTSIYEDMHWILLLLAELLTDQDGIYNTIPSEVIKFSHERSIASQDDLSTNSSNEFVSIIHWIRMFCNLEYESHRLGFMERFSPLLEASFLGFITRFSSSYIMYSEDMYSEISICLATMFGCDSEFSSCMVQQLLEKVQFNLKVWSAEDQVIAKTLSLFQDISCNKEKNKICLASTTFWEVAKESLRDQSQSMTKSNKVKLLKVIFSIIPLSDKNVYIDLEEVLKMNKRNLEELTNTVTKVNISVLPECHKKLSNCLDWLTALVSSVSFVNYKNIYECFQHSWTYISIISDVFHNYDEVLEDCFNIYLTASQFLLPFLQESEAKDFMQSFIILINVYVKHHGRSKNSPEVLYTIQKVLKNFLATEVDVESKFNGLVANILSAIIPLVTPSTLEIPEGITLFSSSLAVVAERHAEAFFYLDEDKCNRLLSLIENILSGKYNNDAVENSLDFVKLFAESLIQNRCSQYLHSHFLGQKLLEIVFHMITNGYVNSEIYTSIGSSLCGLVVLFPQVYQRMAFEAVAKSSMASPLSEKFIALFGILKEMSVIGNEKNRIKHSQSLKSLLFDIGRLTLNLK